MTIRNGCKYLTNSILITQPMLSKREFISLPLRWRTRIFLFSRTGLLLSFLPLFSAILTIIKSAIQDLGGDVSCTSSTRTTARYGRYLTAITISPCFLEEGRHLGDNIQKESACLLTTNNSQSVFDGAILRTNFDA